MICNLRTESFLITSTKLRPSVITYHITHSCPKEKSLSLCLLSSWVMTKNNGREKQHWKTFQKSRFQPRPTITSYFFFKPGTQERKARNNQRIQEEKKLPYSTRQDWRIHSTELFLHFWLPIQHLFSRIHSTEIFLHFWHPIQPLFSRIHTQIRIFQLGAINQRKIGWYCSLFSSELRKQRRPSRR